MILAIILFIAGFLLFPISVFAVSVSISNTPSSVTDQPFTFNVSLSCSGCGPSYLRANVFQTGTDKYFGYTYNGNSFIKSSICSDYLPVTVDSSGNWNGSIQAQIDTSSSYYSGPGNYSLKVRRYTQSCSSYTWSNEVSLTVSIPTPTQSSTQSPTPSSTSSTSSSSFTISGFPSEINSDQSFNVQVNLSLPDNPSTTFFLKGAFKKSDGSNYFGYTKVSGNWIKNSSSYSNQYQITTDPSGNWSGNLEVKGDPDDSGYTGTDDYIFKVGRYTNSGSGPTWSNESGIKIIGSNTNSDQQTSQTTKSSGSTNKQISTAPINPSSKSIVSSSNSVPKFNYQIASVAGASAYATPSASVEVKNEKRINFLPWIGGGLIMAGFGSLIFIYLRSKKPI